MEERPAFWEAYQALHEHGRQLSWLVTQETVHLCESRHMIQLDDHLLDKSQHF